MGKLVEQPITTLFQGVSTQPETVRLPGQVGKGFDVVFSVVTGGFESRSGSVHVAELTALAGATNLGVHAYDRDEAEKYIVTIESGDIHVTHIDGTVKTVNIGDSTRIFAKDADSTLTAPHVFFSGKIGRRSTETQIDLVMTNLAGGLVVEVATSPTGAFAGEETIRKTYSADGSDTVTLEDYIQVKSTTAGTGTEVSPVAVFTHHGVGPSPDVPLKASVSGPPVRPKLAIVDPQLATGSPPELTASCGADALGHAMEACMSRNANPISSTLAGRAPGSQAR